MLEICFRNWQRYYIIEKIIKTKQWEVNQSLMVEHLRKWRRHTRISKRLKAIKARQEDRRLYNCWTQWQARIGMNKIDQLLTEKADNFYRKTLISKAFSRFQQIHKIWNYDPIDKREIETMATHQIQWCMKKRFFNNWQYVVKTQLQPQRLMNEKADEFYTMLLKRKAFIGIISFNSQFCEA